jgi:hypothetical protein
MEMVMYLKYKKFLRERISQMRKMRNLRKMGKIEKMRKKTMKKESYPIIFFQNNKWMNNIKFKKIFLKKMKEY